jgi:hypothetical protein
MSTKKSSSSTSSPTELGRNAREINMKRRRHLAHKYHLKVMDFGHKSIREVMKAHGIPESEVHPDLLKPQSYKYKHEAHESVAPVAIPALPSIPPAPSNYRRESTSGIGNPNQSIIMRVLDLLEKPGNSQATADRLLTLLEKLA